MCKFFVVPGSGQALLGMPDIAMLNIININCTTIVTHGANSTNNCSTNTAIHQSSSHIQHYTNRMQEADRVEKGYANTDIISERYQISQWLLIKNNSINHFLQGPNQDNDKRASAEITQKITKRL